MTDNKEIKGFGASAQVTELTNDNAQFDIKNGFLSMTYTKDGEQKTCDRVFLHRAFPFEEKWRYISVLDEQGAEVGIIFDLELFGEKQKPLIVTELERKYYEPIIKKVESMKERYGFSYWSVVTQDGTSTKFTMQDTFKSIIRIGEDRAILLDVDGNRFVIESIEGLDRKSYKKIELYL